MNLEKARAEARIAKQKRLVDCICENCGKQFTRRLSEVKHGMGKYCSLPCLYAGRKRETATKFGSKKKLNH
jgi:hypothetical protein